MRHRASTRLSAFRGALGMLGLAVAAVAGCGGDGPEQPFERDPQAGVAAKFEACAPDAQGRYPPEARVESGAAADYVWGRGGGCILRPIREVWGALHAREVLQWESDDPIRTELTRLPAPGRVTHLYEAHYFVDAFIDVEWVMRWYMSVTSGPIPDPDAVIVNYQKVRGTKYIDFWEGTIWLDRVAPGVTAFAMHNRVRATRTGRDDAAGAVRDVFRKASSAAPAYADVDGG